MSFRLEIRKDKQVGYELGLLGTRDRFTLPIPNHMLPCTREAKPCRTKIPSHHGSKAWPYDTNFADELQKKVLNGDLPFPNRSQRPKR